jgi:predicted DNA-binding transcriptional regulator AlpA
LLQTQKGDQQMARSILRRSEVLKRTGLSSTTQWRLEGAGEFPERIRLTEAGSVGWFEDEVDQWVHERVRGAGKMLPPRNRASAA